MYIDFRETQLSVLTLYDDAKNVISESQRFINISRIKDLIVPRGIIYICTSNWDGYGPVDDKIIKIKL